MNPGAARVTSLAHEPRVAVAVIEALLAPHRSTGRLRVLLRHRPVAVAVDGDHVRAVEVRDLDGGDRRVLHGAYVLDATETGELLALSGTEHVVGAEAATTTGEPHAADVAAPSNCQPVSVCFAVDHLDGQDHTIDRPATYAFWRDYRPKAWPGPQLSFVAPHNRTNEPITLGFAPNPAFAVDTGPSPFDGDPEGLDLWLYRRIIARGNFAASAYASDITLVNWSMIDYLEGPVLDGADEADDHLQAARELSLSALYWLQTEAPRPDGGAGYPGLRPRGDVVGTSDGLAKAPYVRESRRIAAAETVREQDLCLEARGSSGAVSYPDSVGIGSYRIDLHPSTGGDGYIDIGACPFEIPLGALLPVRVRNLLPAAKNIGTTHITNGCYRLHPVEWNVGEIAGLLASYCLTNAAEPQQVRSDPDHLERFQTLATHHGVELRWPDITGY